MPAVSIVCAEDRAITPDWSRRVARDWLGVAPIEIAGGHSPHLTRPRELAALLDRLARTTFGVRWAHCWLHFAPKALGNSGLDEVGERAKRMIIPVIMCGGAGTRLWPASRSDSPKPFLPLVDGASTFALTLQRIAEPSLFGPAVVIAGADHAHLVAAALAEAGTAAVVLLEPEGRDTAAAIAAAAAFVAAEHPEATLLVLAADHVIRDHAGFRATVDARCRPRRPARSSSSASRRPGRPPATATSSPARRWPQTAPAPSPNSSRSPTPSTPASTSPRAICGTAASSCCAPRALAELGTHAPEVAAAAHAAVAAGEAADGGAVLHLDRQAFAAAPKISFDRAVMEKTANAAVADARFDWSDLGTWGAVWDAGSRDAAGNVAIGDAVLVDATDSYVSTSRPKVGVVGVSDVVVVATDDAVLVASRGEPTGSRS